MHREEQNELAKLHSLMDRMDKHLTSEQAEIHKTNYLNESLSETSQKRSGVYQHDSIAHNLSSPEELIQALTTDGISPKKSWFVTIGYVHSFKELGNKTIRTSVTNFDDDALTVARSLGNDRLNNILDNPTYVEKGKTKGNIRNPYMPNSDSNFIVEASIIRLMYGRNDEYAVQKNNVYKDLEQYQKDHPEDVQYYMDKKRIMDFPLQAYDDLRANTTTKVDGTNAYQRADGSYEMRFNTPKAIFKKLKTQYFLITDENTVEPITKEEAEAYANLYGTTPTKKVETDEVLARVAKDIEQIKLNRHKGDVWGRFKLDSIFFMNFSEGENSKNKLQYYNPDAIVTFVEDKVLKSGPVPGRKVASGVMNPYFDSFVGK